MTGNKLVANLTCPLVDLLIQSALDTGIIALYGPCGIGAAGKTKLLNSHHPQAAPRGPDGCHGTGCPQPCHNDIGRFLQHFSLTRYGVRKRIQMQSQFYRVRHTSRCIGRIPNRAGNFRSCKGQRRRESENFPGVMLPHRGPGLRHGKSIGHRENIKPIFCRDRQRILSLGCGFAKEPMQVKVRCGIQQVMGGYGKAAADGTDRQLPNVRFPGYLCDPGKKPNITAGMIKPFGGQRTHFRVSRLLFPADAP